MAAVKKLRATYYCKTDEDRNALEPHIGETCMMADGTVYVCFAGGVWEKTDISSGGGGGGGGADPTWEHL